MSSSMDWLCVSTIGVSKQINDVIREKLYEFSYTPHEIVYLYLTLKTPVSDVDAVNDREIRSIIRDYLHRQIVEYTGLRLSNLVEVRPDDNLGMLFLGLSPFQHRHFFE